MTGLEIDLCGLTPTDAAKELSNLREESEESATRGEPPPTSKGMSVLLKRVLDPPINLNHLFEPLFLKPNSGFHRRRNSKEALHGAYSHEQQQVPGSGTRVLAGLSVTYLSLSSAASIGAARWSHLSPSTTRDSEIEIGPAVLTVEAASVPPLLLVTSTSESLIFSCRHDLNSNADTCTLNTLCEYRLRVNGVELMTTSSRLSKKEIFLGNETEDCSDILTL